MCGGFLLFLEVDRVDIKLSVISCLFIKVGSIVGEGYWVNCL